MRKNFNQFVSGLVILLIWSGIVFPSALHTYHSTLTRMNYNHNEKLFEITIQLFTHDLIPTLEKRVKKQIDLEKMPDIDKFLLNYVNENFVLMDKKGEKKELNWVGKEIKSDTVNILIEVPSSEDFNNYSLQNTLFFESFPEQTNFVIVRFAEKKADLLFKVGDKFKVIKEKTKEVNIIKSIMFTSEIWGVSAVKPEGC